MKDKKSVKTKRVGFGGALACFKDVDTPAEEIFGSDPIGYGEVVKRIHIFMKENDLVTKPKSSKKSKKVVEEDEEEESSEEEDEESE